jgi:hypothetical protein
VAALLHIAPTSTKRAAAVSICFVAIDDSIEATDADTYTHIHGQSRSAAATAAQTIRVLVALQPVSAWDTASPTINGSFSSILSIVQARRTNSIDTHVGFTIS